MSQFFLYILYIDEDVFNIRQKKRPPKQTVERSPEKITSESPSRAPQKGRSINQESLSPTPGWSGHVLTRVNLKTCPFLYIYIYTLCQTLS